MSQKRMKMIRRFVRESYGNAKDIIDMKKTYRYMNKNERRDFVKRTKEILSKIV